MLLPLIIQVLIQKEACKLDIRWADDIFKEHGIKLTEDQIEAINAIRKVKEG